MKNKSIQVEFSEVANRLKGRIEWFEYIREEEFTAEEKQQILAKAVAFMNFLNPIVEKYIDGTPKSEAMRFKATKHAA